MHASCAFACASNVQGGFLVSAGNNLLWYADNAQEKTTFVQVFGKAAVRADVLWLPALLQLLLVFLAGAVLFVQTAPQEKDAPAGFAPLLGGEDVQEATA